VAEGPPRGEGDPLSDTKPVERRITLADEGSRLVGRNVLANFVTYALNACIAIWFTRYLLDHLGTACYGLVPLAMNFNEYMAIFTVAFSSAVGRYLTMELARGDDAQTNRTFNTALFGMGALLVCVLPVGLVVALSARWLINIPPEAVQDSQWLFVSTISAFGVWALSSCFAVSLFARSRFDLRGGISAFGMVARVALVVVLFSLGRPQLAAVGLGIVANAVLVLLAHVWTWRWLTPHLRVRLSDFDRRRLREILLMGGWVSVAQLGNLLFTQIDLLLVNILAGAEWAGRYAPLLQWSTTLRTLAGMLSVVLTPTIIACYALSETGRLIRITRMAMTVLGLGLAVCVGLICGMGRSLLRVWLGESFVELTPLLWTLTGALAVNLCVLPLLSIQQAANRVAWPGITTVALGVANVALGWTFAGPLGHGAYGVATAGLICFSLRNAVYNTYYTSRILGLRWTAFGMPLLRTALFTAVVAALGWGASELFSPTRWPHFLGCAALVTVVALAIAGTIGLSGEERKWLMQIVRRGERLGGAAQSPPKSAAG